MWQSQLHAEVLTCTDRMAEYQSSVLREANDRITACESQYQAESRAKGLCESEVVMLRSALGSAHAASVAAQNSERELRARYQAAEAAVHEARHAEQRLVLEVHAASPDRRTQLNQLAAAEAQIRQATRCRPQPLSEKPLRRPAILHRKRIRVALRARYNCWLPRMPRSEDSLPSIPCRRSLQQCLMERRHPSDRVDMSTRA